MKKNIIFCISIFLFISCSNKEHDKLHFEFNKETQNIKIVEFEEIKKIAIPYNELIKYEFKFKNDSILIVSGLKNRANLIYTHFINTKTNKVKTEVLDFKFDIAGPLDFGYINKDSIFLLYPPAYRGNYHDSILLLINNEGDIKKSYSFDDAPVFTKNNPQYDNNDEAVFLSYNLFEPFTFIDNKIFINFGNQAKVLGDPAYSNLPLAGFINAKTEKIQQIKFEYPDIIYGKTFFAGYDNAFVSTLGKRNHILYGFSYTPIIIDYNYETSEFEKHFIKSSVYDTIYPSLTEKDVPGGLLFDAPQPKYFNLIYDKFRKLYFRVIMAPPKDYKGKLSVVIADEKFNFVAEGFLPDFNSFRIFFTKDYVILLNYKHIDTKGKKYLIFYKLKFRDGTNQELISEIKAEKIDIKLINKPVTHYIKKNTNIKDKNYTATFMYYEMCPKVREFVLGFYQFNKKKLSKNQINLFLVTQNVEALRNDLKRYNLLPENNSNIFIDSTYAFASYNGNNRNDLPRIVKIRKNKIVTDTVFNNDDGNFHENFQKFLIASGKEQKILKQK